MKHFVWVYTYWLDSTCSHLKVSVIHRFFPRRYKRNIITEIQLIQGQIFLGDSFKVKSTRAFIKSATGIVRNAFVSHAIADASGHRIIVIGFLTAEFFGRDSVDSVPPYSYGRGLPGIHGDPVSVNIRGFAGLVNDRDEGPRSLHRSSRFGFVQVQNDIQAGFIARHLLLSVLVESEATQAVISNVESRFLQTVVRVVKGTRDKYVSQGIAHLVVQAFVHILNEDFLTNKFFDQQFFQFFFKTYIF